MKTETGQVKVQGNSRKDKAAIFDQPLKYTEHVNSKANNAGRNVGSSWLFFYLFVCGMLALWPPV